MWSTRVITLTTAAIQRNIIKMNKVINDIEYYKKYYYNGTGDYKNSTIGKRNKNKVVNIRATMAQSYVMKVLNKANIVDGIPCVKCDEMIRPNEECMARYRRNTRIPFPSWYHVNCYEKLYH